MTTSKADSSPPPNAPRMRPKDYENEAIIGLRFKIALPFWNKNEGAIQEAEARKERKEKESSPLGAASASKPKPRVPRWRNGHA